MSEPFDPIDRATRALREPVATDPAAKRRLVEALRAAPPPRRSAVQRAWRWIARPRQIMISPLAGLAAAAAAVLVIALRPEPMPTVDGSAATSNIAVAPAGSRGPADVIPAALASAATDAAIEGPTPVRFIFLAPTASTVSIVGDFNGWDPAATPLQAGRDPGVWVVDVPLSPGRHVYSFIVDGRQWHPDPLTARAPESDLEAPSSVVLVGGRAL